MDSEKIFANDVIDKGLISKTYKQLIQFSNNSKKITQQKNGQKTLQTFLQRRHIDGNRYMKRCSSLLIFREMQIKTTMRYHLTPVRTAIIKKSTNNKCWRGCGEKGTLLHCWWEYKLVQPTMETSMEVPQKTKNRTTIRPSNPTTGHIP